MELIVVTIFAVGLGVLATVLLAVCLPAHVHERAREHGRFAQLGEAPDEADPDAPLRMSAYEGRVRTRRERAKARARRHAGAVRDALLHRRRAHRRDPHRDFVA
ncbi:hypothetical protein [Paraburkholderia phosphatilytica]|uniref:hypothetical protein n=1 Tax=Paraburkholderia phosphatilytica TaxID=2282883 RepID=UPI000E4CFADF|nr:hypothetical protein [Paraburkholderia phosphatilytica]